MNLMQHLPDYYVNNQSMETLQGLLSIHINTLAEDFNNTLNQCFVNTATELLSRYEKIYGLTVDVTKNHEFRRERIRAKIRGTGTVTKQMIAQVARSYSNGEVEVVENNENSSFLVRFVGTKGIPANIADLRLTIEEIKPAQLRFEFEYTYNTWKDIGHMTWGEAAELTWGEIRER
jgi:hypothetical protein